MLEWMLESKNYLPFCNNEMKTVELQVSSWPLFLINNSNSFNSPVVSFLPCGLESSMRRLSHATEKNKISTVLSPISSSHTDFFCGLEQIISSSYVLAYQLYKNPEMYVLAKCFKAVR